ncbi:MAG TPA: A/G-specific adenine glycosylase [Sphingomicrobium sp.]|nr:A/G-specific adenine glycosylase [Sphingomicrobium sp.]
MTANVPERLLKHYVDNFRRLPWRAAPGTAAPDPYRTWLSEVMLQQTTVAAVIPRFERFVARWPTVAALAAALDEEVLSEWAGLGYYARARNLIACAREVARRGAFPSSAAELRRLPGVGDYTAAAIAAIAFGERCAAVDTNVTRVMARLHGIKRPARSAIRDLTLALAPADRPGDFVQAIMDLGATVCRPASPLCHACPLASDCAACASGVPAAFPERLAKRARPRRFGIAYWIERDGRVWLVRRPDRGLLGGMAALPTTDWTTERPDRRPATVGVVHHGFTHFTLELQVERAGEPSGTGWWQPVERLGEAGLPTLFRRAAELALREPAAAAAAA